MDTINDPYSAYTLIREIRAGGEGKAILMEKDGVKFICKQRIFETINEANAGLKEAYSLAGVKDDNIVKFEEVFLRTIPGDTHIYLCIIVEYCPKGDLLDFLIEMSAIAERGMSTTSSATSTISMSSVDSSNIESDQHVPTATISSTSDDRKCVTSYAKDLMKRICEANGDAPVARPPSVEISKSTSSSSLNLSTLSLHSSTIGEPAHSVILIERQVLIVWLKQLCNGVRALHKEHLIHRDLKCENVFIAGNDRLKIGDFGLATKTKNDKGHGRVGTYVYSAPEVLENKTYDRSADIFSLGCIFYELITLKLLVPGRRYLAEEMINDTFDKLKFLSEFPSRYEYLGPVVMKMLDRNPSFRPSIEWILEKIEGNNIGASFSFLNQQKHLSVDTSGNPTSDQSLQSSSRKQEGLQGIRKQLSKLEFKETAALLARAFKNDPRYNGIFPVDEPESQKHLAELFKFSIKVMNRNSSSIWGYFDAKNTLKSACIWVNPDKKKGVKYGDILVGGFSFMTKVGIKKAERGSKIFKAINEVLSKENDSKHWFLAYIGTEEEMRSEGIGSYLIEPVLEWADHSRYQCKTLTFTKKCLPFFQRMGFEVTREVTGSPLPKGLDALWILTREPKLPKSHSGK
eukprot:gene4373-5115_t